MSLSLAQYARFLFIGGVVGLFSLACRELIGRGLGDSTELRYSISVLTAYVAGIVLSFCLNRALTFRSRVTSTWSRFPAFVAVACTGMLLTWLLALSLRHLDGLEGLFGRYSATAAFAVATLLATLITYPLNACPCDG